MSNNHSKTLMEPVPFGRLLREFRIKAGLSQEMLAELAHMSVGGVGVLERGVRRAPQRQTLELLAAALKLSDSEREQFNDGAKRGGNWRRRARASDSNVRRHNLPFTLSSFVGRDDALDALRRNIIEHRLVTLTGAGGVGKTRLAIETAHGLVDEFRDGVWFAELAPLADVRLVAQRVADTLGVSGGAETDSDEAWIEKLAHKNLLLILDNCEHLRAECATLTELLLARCPQLHIVATTRERLSVFGERVVRLGSLREQAAIELFLDRAKDASPDFTVSESDRESWQYLNTICEQLDGIPFAIELAAARVSALSLKTLSRNLGQRLDFLRHGSAVVPRHKTMRALVDWSYDLLADPEKRVFEALSIFDGGCVLEEAAKVCVGDAAERLDVLDLLSSLVDKSLVVVDFDGDEPRYDLLETSREYAWEKLGECNDVDGILQRHAVAYLDLAKRIDEKWSTTPNRAWHVQARAELGNWRSAIKWALSERHDVLLGQRLVGSLHAVWITFALADGRQSCRSALELVDDATPRDVVAKLEYTEAIIAFLSGESTSSLAAAERALADYQALFDARGIARSKTVAGRVLVESGKISEGEPKLRDALEIARSIDDPLLAAVAHQGLGISRSMSGDLESARQHVAEALAIAKSASADRIALVAGMVSAEVHFRAGETSAAIQIAREAVTFARALGDEFAMMRTLANLSTFLLGADEYEEARKSAREALEFSGLAQGATTVAWTLQHLATVAAVRAHVDTAVAFEDHARAARLLGFVEARFAALGAHGDFSEQQEHERLRTVLAATLSDSDRTQFMSFGAAITEYQAIEEAMAI